MAEVVAAAQGFDADPENGAIVWTGSEKAFAAGADIAETATSGHRARRESALRRRAEEQKPQHHEVDRRGETLSNDPGE